MSTGKVAGAAFLGMTPRRCQWVGVLLTGWPGAT